MLPRAGPCPDVLGGRTAGFPPSEGTPSAQRLTQGGTSLSVGNSRMAMTVPLATTSLYLNVINSALCKGNTPRFSQTWGTLSLPSVVMVVCVAHCVLNQDQDV